MPTVTITHPDGSTETIPKTVSFTRTRELNRMRRARITVERSLAEAVTLNRKSDTIALGDIDTLRLVDVETGGDTWTLVCYSFEWDANREPPTQGGNKRQGTDKELINGLIGDVSAWSAGSISELTGPMTYVFNHADLHDSLRRIERNVPGEIEFRDKGTIDYVDERGTDKSGSVELSATAGTIEDGISITERGRELDGTHIRVLGAHEGEAQIFANLVPDGDSGNYENEVTYTTSRWSSSDDTDWDTWANKEVTDQGTIEEEAAALGEELTDPLVEAETTAVGVDLELGDYVQVVKPDANLDRKMRVHRIKTEQKGATRRDKVLLSTRTTLRRDDSRNLRDIQQFNKGFQGSSVVIQGGGSRQPVDPTNNAEIPFDYPNIEYENSAELHVRGLNYRHYSTPNDHNHNVTVTHPQHDHTVDVTHPSHNHDVDIQTTSAQNTEFTNTVFSDSFSDIDSSYTSGSWNTITSFGDTLSNTKAYTIVVFQLDAIDMSRAESQVRVSIDSGSDYSPNSTGQQFLLRGGDQNDQDDDVATVTGVIPISQNWENLSLQIDPSFDLDVTQEAVAVYGAGPHTHDISDTETSTSELGTTSTETSSAELGDTETTTSSDTAGVTPGIEETANVPDSVDVLVNGNTVATSIGNGTFETVVDISGELNKGQWNLIELTSNALGHIQATVSVDGYKQIGTQ